jgi:phenylacetate-coenzyme A ligase PaaK-like adenylate-forming protein
MDKEMLKDVEIDLSMKHSFEKFKGLLDYAYEHVPYYRRIWNEMGISPEDILTFEDIKKLPIIDKRTVLENYNEFISDEVDINDLVQHSTGGSSGVTLTVLYDQNTVRARRLGILRWMNFAGLKPSDKGVWIGRASESLLQDRTMWGGVWREVLWIL